MNFKDGIFTSDLIPALHGFTTRSWGNLGYGKNYGDPEVTANRAKLFEHLGVQNRTHIQPRQIHSTKVIDSREFVSGIEADGSFTNSSDHLLSVLTADCLPILFYHPDGIVAAVHAGWKGLLNGIIPEAVRIIPDKPIVVIGPAIGVCCYEVSEDLAADFVNKFGVQFVDQSKTKPHLDLIGVAIHQLLNGGAEEVEASHLCTKCHPELFFSYRRDGSSGRQMAFIGR
ncbi:MAG TPA: peptidoglycan editing factor PgeF [Acidobacteriota bacterium]|nr:peptidoglycan editing factor PgeF [Acidobacteriota bacterium]